MAGLVAGSATAVFFFTSGYLGMDLRPLDLHEGVLGLLVHIPVLVAVSLATQPQDPDHTESFVSPRGSDGSHG